MSAPKTLFDKIWERHTVDSSAQGDTLLYVDRCLIHEGSSHAFDKLHADGQTIILVTHEDHIARHALRTIRLRDGKIESDVFAEDAVAA